MKRNFSVYTSDSPLTKPKAFIIDAFGDLRASRGLAWRLFIRDLSSQYRQSVLGYLWALLPPLATTITFVLLKDNGLFNPGDMPVPYTVYVIISTLLWQVFTDAINSPIRSISSNKAMIVKINLPKEGVLLAGIFMIGFNFLIRLILLIVVLLIFNVVPAPTILLLPIGVFSILCLGYTIGLFLAPIGILFKDIQNALPMVLGFGMIITPVVYSPTKSGILKAISNWNPLTPLLNVTRDWVILGWGGDISAFALVAVISFVFLMVSWMVLRVALPHLIERMGG